MAKTLIQKRMETLAGWGWYPSVRLVYDGSWRVHILRGGGGSRRSMVFAATTPVVALTKAYYWAAKRKDGKE